MWFGLVWLVACSGDEPSPTDGPAPRPVVPTGATGMAPTADTGLPCDACTSSQVCDQDVCVDPAVLVYLNFDAEGTFSYTPDAVDASNNEQASDESLVGKLSGYGSGPARSVVTSIVLDDFASFAPTADRPSPNGIHLVLQRPVDRTDYHMVVVTRNAPIPGQIGLGSPTNCGNAEKNEIFFAFVAEDDGRPNAFQGNLISAAIGNLVGLARVDDATDLMASSFALDADLSVRDTCLDLVGTDLCSEFNAMFCPDGQQNTAAVLRSHANL